MVSGGMDAPGAECTIRLKARFRIKQDGHMHHCYCNEAKGPRQSLQVRINNDHCIIKNKSQFNQRSIVGFALKLLVERSAALNMKLLP